MIFEEKRNGEKIGKIIGFLFSFFLFTTILFFVSNYFSGHHIGYHIVILITLGLVIIGQMLKRYLK